MATEEEKRGFTVIDRRGGREEAEETAPSGEPEAKPAERPGGEPGASEARAQPGGGRAEPGSGEPGRAPASADSGSAAGPEAPDSGALPAIDFSTFILSLGTSALYHMGVVGGPEGGEGAPEPNLALARQTIDTLEMLEAKTRGNLEREETRLLEGLLFELRMRFVEMRG